MTPNSPPMNDPEIHFNAPVGASPEELAAQLDKACGGDAVLRAQVESLFARDAAAGESFMESPPVARALVAGEGRTELMTR